MVCKPSEPDVTWEKAELAAIDGNHRELVLLLQRLHSMGQWRVTAQIGAMYELGAKGINIDLEKAVTWYRKAVFESDDPVAHLGLGRMHFCGSSTVPKDLRRASEHLLKAFKKSKPEAGIYLGLMFMYGHGFTRDLSSAKTYLCSAADANFPIAHRYLAVVTLLRHEYLESVSHLVKEKLLRFKLWRHDSSHPNLWRLN